MGQLTTKKMHMVSKEEKKLREFGKEKMRIRKSYTQQPNANPKCLSSVLLELEVASNVTPYVLTIREKRHGNTGSMKARIWNRFVSCCVRIT